jgi:uncharacterized peroxidase-related enzyme
MAHGAGLRRESGDAELASHIMHDYTQAELDPKTRAILDYAYKLTVAPSDVHHDDFVALQAAGVNDQEALSTVLITSLFNFMTRIADGLGVEPAPGRQKLVEEWLLSPARDQRWLMEPKT